MEFLPLDIENIILDYKSQMEHSEKTKKLIREFNYFSNPFCSALTIYNIKNQRRGFYYYRNLYYTKM